jgi:hypothetical protein
MEIVVISVFLHVFLYVIYIVMRNVSTEKKRPGGRDECRGAAGKRDRKTGTRDEGVGTGE